MALFAEGIALNSDTIDFAMIMGTGFPPFRGGIMQYADEIGRAKVIERLKHYEQLYGPRFKPAEADRKMGAF